MLEKLDTVMFYTWMFITLLITELTKHPKQSFHKIDWISTFSLFVHCKSNVLEFFLNANFQAETDTSDKVFCEKFIQ